MKGLYRKLPVAEKTGIAELKLTSRDVSDCDVLMTKCP